MSLAMNSVARRLSSFLRQSGCAAEPLIAQLQQCRGIRVQVYNGTLDGALALMQRKMTSSGIERMIKKEHRFHIKNSEKRVLAQKSLERSLRSQDLSSKLKAIMIKKVR
jgi:small subunit ribosomal protein S21